MIDTKHILIDNYSYDLPQGRIAEYPLSRRDASKLLLYRKGQISEDVFSNLPQYLPQGSLMVFNNTRVIQARLHFRKSTGALVEVFLLEPMEPADYERVFQSMGHCSWLCMVGNLKKWKEGTLERRINVKNSVVTISAAKDNDYVGKGQYEKIDFSWDKTDVSFAELLEVVGELPIPPYLGRESQESDKTTYQTVYSKIKGSVAAPTAGLHFTDEVLAALDDKGIEREELTLHVGAGTFKPVKSREIEGHVMHTEHVCVRRRTIERLIAHGGKATAVGTTSARTLESLYYMGMRMAENPGIGYEALHVSQWEPYNEHIHLTSTEALGHVLAFLQREGLDSLHGSTQIMIAPGYEYKVTERLITNFHQPRSTLLLLVSAFTKGDWRGMYDYALSHSFRFLSYGDCSLIEP